MNAYRVENMTCGHCVRTVENAIHALDATAQVDVDLAGGLVRIDGRAADAARFADALRIAGYPAALVTAGSEPTPAAGPSPRGCCCG